MFIGGLLLATHSFATATIHVVAGSSNNLICLGDNRIVIDMSMYNGTVAASLNNAAGASGDPQPTNITGTGFNITYNGPGTYNILCFYSNGGGGSFSIGLTVIAPTLTGPTQLCVGNQPVYTFNAGGGPGKVIWSFPSFITDYSTSAYTPQQGYVNAGGTGVITVTVNNGVCPAGSPSSLLTLNVSAAATPPPAPSGTHMVQETNQCYFNAVAYASAGANSYDWSLNGFSSVLETDPTPRTIYEFMPSTAYSVSIRATNACGFGPVRTTRLVTLNPPAGCVWRVGEGATGIQDEQEVKETVLFPNPARNSFEISFPSQDSPVQVQMLNMEGSVIRDFMTTDKKVLLETSDIPAGLYIVRLSSDKLNAIKKIQVIK